MKKLWIVKENNRGVVFANAVLATGFVGRLKGLMFKKRLHGMDALCLMPCNSIHTFFMRFSIDVIFLGKEGQVLKIIHELKPNKVSPIIRKSSCVIETTGGFCKLKGVKEGEKWEIISQIGTP